MARLGLDRPSGTKYKDDHKNKPKRECGQSQHGWWQGIRRGPRAPLCNHHPRGVNSLGPRPNRPRADHSQHHVHGIVVPFQHIPRGCLDQPSPKECYQTCQSNGVSHEHK